MHEIEMYFFEIWNNSIIFRRSDVDLPIWTRLLNWNYNCVKLQKQVYDEWFISTFLLFSSRFELDLGVEKGHKGKLIKYNIIVSCIHRKLVSSDGICTWPALKFCVSTVQCMNIINVEDVDDSIVWSLFLSLVRCHYYRYY